MEIFEHDSRYRMVGYRASRGGDRLVRREQVFDGAGNVLAVSDLLDGGRSRSFDYDMMSRLVRATGPFGPGGARATVEYEWDPVGNRVYQTAPWAGRAYWYGYESGPGGTTSRLRSITSDQGDTVAVAHDAAGNVTTGETSGYVYGPRGTMTGSYRSNADGLRVLTQGGLGHHPARVFHYPDGRPILEKYWVSIAGNPLILTRSHVYLGDRLLAFFDNEGTVHHVLSDHMAFPLAVVDGEGEVEWQAEAAPFGGILEVVAGTNGADPLLRYPGQRAQSFVNFGPPLELVNNVHRWYRPDWGRYVQPDPAEMGAVTAAELEHRVLEGWLPESSYEYARGNPLRFADPLGLRSGGAMAGGHGGNKGEDQLFWQGHWRVGP